MDPSTHVVLRRRADRSFHSWGVPLCAALSHPTLPPLPSFPHTTVTVRYATEHRCGVRIRGPHLTDAITGTDPLHDDLPLLPCLPTPTSPRHPPSPDALHTCRVVAEVHALFHAVLSAHPITAARVGEGLPAANVVLLRGAG